jgi:hypothetical protein
MKCRNYLYQQCTSKPFLLRATTRHLMPVCLSCPRLLLKGSHLPSQGSYFTTEVAARLLRLLQLLPQLHHLEQTNTESMRHRPFTTTHRTHAANLYRTHAANLYITHAANLYRTHAANLDRTHAAKLDKKTGSTNCFTRTHCIASALPPPFPLTTASSPFPLAPAARQSLTAPSHSPAASSLVPLGLVLQSTAWQLPAHPATQSALRPWTRPPWTTGYFWLSA